MIEIPVVGFDPSKNHWGIAQGIYNIPADKLIISNLSVIEPVLPSSKQVRTNSKDLEAAKQLSEGALAAMRTSKATFVEIPSGTQSARGSVGYGICIGVLATLRMGGMPFFEQTPNDVKRAATGKITASKAEVIAWAREKHPEANWPLYKKNGEWLLSAAQAEHMADAIATIYSGLRSNEFQQTLSLLKAA